MTVFKAFLRVLNKNKATVLLYTVILISFAGLNLQTSDNSTNFVASKPDIVIVDNDDSELTASLKKYLSKNCNLKNISKNGEKIEDALFYREVNYVIYIPKNFEADFMDGKNPQLQVKTTGNYQGSYAQMLLNRYIKTANGYLKQYSNVDKVIDYTETTVSKETKVEMTGKLDSQTMTRVAFYFNFANYSLMAGGILVICMIVSSFREEKVRRRIVISSMSYKKHNRILLMSNGLFAFTLWAFYVGLSFIMLGTKAMANAHGLMYIVNSFVFTINVLTLSFLISNIVISKNAISGIVNVVALGSSFLCGCFVPSQWLPDAVTKVAHIFPSYWYIDANNRLAKIETINFENLKPVFTNMAVVLGFALVFIVITNVLSRKKMEN